MTVASTADYRESCRKRLPHFLYEGIDGGAYDEVTMRRNISDLQDVLLRQRVLRDASALNLSSRVLGRSLAMPVLLGPVGSAGLYSRRGEVAAARAAQEAGAGFCLSTMSVCSIEEVATGTEQPFWFQLYMMRDRQFTRELMARAAAARCSALVLTVDLPMAGVRYRDVRSGFVAPPFRGAMRRAWQAACRPRWAWDVALRGRPLSIGNFPEVPAEKGTTKLLTRIRGGFDPTVTWKDLDFVRREWNGPLVIKGILDPEDAKLAVHAGADAIIVSNHGGRQLDGTLSTAAALPAIVKAVADRVEIFVDGGVRSGLDVIRMIALGANAVLLGRAWAYALGGAGKAGVDHILQLIAAEMRVAMALTGCANISEIDSSVLVDRTEPTRPLL